MGYITKRCPQCRNKIIWSQKWRFTTLYGSRRVRPCPHCGAKLRWSRIPWYIINTGVIILLAILYLAFRHDSIRGGIFMFLYLMDMIIMFIAAVFLEFEVVESNGDKKTGVAP